MAALSSLTSTWQQNLNYNAALNPPGGIYNPNTSGNNIGKSQTAGTGVGNTVTGGADCMFLFPQAITAGSSVTIDLDALTDVFLRTSQTIARIKVLRIRLLSSTDDSTLSPAPTATSSITVTNIGPAVPTPLDFNNGGSSGTVALTASGAVTGVAVGAGGSGYPKSSFFLASPQQTGGSGCVFLCTVNSSGVISAVTFITGAGGSGYSAATVPLVPVGQYNILTGGSHMYMDPAANGFCLVSTTSRNLRIQNMDATNDVTVEIALPAGST